MDFVRAGAVALLLLLTGFTELLVSIEPAAAQRITLQQSNYETLREMLKARAPDLADKIDRRLDEIDKGPGTAEEKEQRKLDYLNRELEQADQILQAARQIGGNVTAAEEVRSILRSMWVNQKGETDILGNPFNPAIILNTSALQQEFRDTERRLREEREKAAEQQGDAANQPLGFLPFRPLMEGEANQGRAEHHH